MGHPFYTYNALLASVKYYNENVVICCLVVGDLQDGVADAAVGSLDVEQGADGGGDVGDVALCLRGSMLDTPAEEDEGDVAVVGVPQSVGGAGVDMIPDGVVGGL